VRHPQLSRIGGLVIAFCLIRAAPVTAQEGLRPRVEALEAQVATLTGRLDGLTQLKFIDVDCSAGGTIQAALASAQNHPAPVVITVFGVCSENVVILRNEVMIRAGAAGSGITAASATQHVIRSGSPGIRTRSLTLTGLTITGGLAGVFADFGMVVHVRDCVFRNNDTGVSIDHQGIVRLENTVVENSAGHAALAVHGAQLFMSGGALRGSASDGLALRAGASADVRGAAEIASSGAYGVILNSGSTLAFEAATVTGSAFSGIFVSGGSRVSLGRGAVITANTRNGITLTDTSVAQKLRSETDIHITNNGQFGVGCSAAPAAALLVGFGINTGNISGNGQGNINCAMSPVPPGG
jgi:hypothetical protein